MNFQVSQKQLPSWVTSNPQLDLVADNFTNTSNKGIAGFGLKMEKAISRQKVIHHHLHPPSSSHQILSPLSISVFFLFSLVSYFGQYFCQFFSSVANCSVQFGIEVVCMDNEFLLI